MSNAPQDLYDCFDKLGIIVATPGAIDALAGSKESSWDLLTRHRNGDHGDLPDEDKQTNAMAIKNGWRIMSSYTLTSGVRLWVLTEGDRSATTILLPEEY